MRTSHRIAWNAVITWIGNGFNILVGFILVPFLLGIFDKDGYGLLLLASSLVVFSRMADFGLRNALGRQLAAELADGAEGRFNELVSTAAVIYLLFGGLLATICFVFAPTISRVFQPPPELATEAVNLIRYYGGVSLFTSFVGPLFESVITAHNRFSQVHGTRMLATATRGSLLLLVLGLTPARFNGWILIMLFEQLVFVAGLAVMAYRTTPTLRLRPALFRNEHVRPLFSLGGEMYLMQIAYVLTMSADRFIITQFFGPTGVGLYAPGQAIPSRTRELVLTIGRQLHPLTTAFHVRSDRGGLYEALTRGTRITLVLGIPIFVALLTLGEPIIRFWVGARLGPEYVLTVSILIGWAITDLFDYAGAGEMPVLLGMNRLRYVAAVRFVAAFLNIGLSVYLVGYTSLGITGAIVGTALVSALLRPVLTLHTLRVCDFPIRPYLTRTFVRPAALLGGLLAIAWIVRTLIPTDTLLGLLAAAATIGLTWVPGAWFVGFEPDERVRIQDILAEGLRRLRR